MKAWLLLGFIIFFLYPSNALVINEIMYNPVGEDSGREWVEIYNNDSETYNMTGWKFNTNNTNHTLYVPPQNGGRGSMLIEPSQYLIIAQNATSFIDTYTDYNGTVIDGTWPDLKNSANETIWIRNSTNVFHSITNITNSF